MATKTINLSEESYKRLAALKKENESFSDVVNRMTGKHKLRELIGILSDKEAAEFRKAARETSEKMKSDMGRIAKKMQ